MYAIILWLASNPAVADTPVLYDSTPKEAVDRAVRYDAGHPWDLDPLRPDQLLTGTRAGLVGVEPTCQRAPASAADLSKSVELATEHFQRQSWAEADLLLRQARAELSCLTDEADAARVAQLHLMAGIVAHELDRPDDALEAFDRAHRFGANTATGEPMAWNNRLASPSHGGAAFEQAAAALDAVQHGILRMAPGVDPGRVDLRVDGRAVPLSANDSLSLAEGYHHVQVVSSTTRGRAVRTFEVDVSPDVPVVVADPSGLGDLQLAPHVGSPALADFIRAAGIHGRTWVVTDTEVWTLEDTWRQVPQPVHLDPLEARDRTTSRRAAGLTALISGVVVGSLSAWGRSTVADSPSWERKTTAQEARVMQSRAWTGLAVLGAGGVVAGTTLLVTNPRTP
jgi:hypothetical protein